MSAIDLKSRWKLDRENYTEEFDLRTHRAISWLIKAEAVEDNDSKFIFYWISFNAVYANNLNKVVSSFSI